MSEDKHSGIALMEKVTCSIKIDRATDMNHTILRHQSQKQKSIKRSTTTEELLRIVMTIARTLSLLTYF